MKFWSLSLPFSPLTLAGSIVVAEAAGVTFHDRQFGYHCSCGGLYDDVVDVTSLSALDVVEINKTTVVVVVVVVGAGRS